MCALARGRTAVSASIEAPGLALAMAALSSQRGLALGRLGTPTAAVSDRSCALSACGGMGFALFVAGTCRVSLRI